MTQTELTVEQRINALHPAAIKIMGDFGYQHLTRDDLKQTSKIFHDAMLTLFETLARDSVVYNVEDISPVANKVWEGKNLAVHLIAKRS